MPDVDLAVIRSRFATGWPPSVLSGQPGWHGLIVELDRALVEVMPDIQYNEIKQKYGTLRVYVEQGDPRVNALICEAEQRAARTCEICGGPGRLRQRKISRWLKTLCDGCAEEQGYGKVVKGD
ncbi:Uncharacterised protein [Mycobacteroides abscessus subsp. abscessus]|uniref:hypothetical protein n=1 Tax=Mycobacteroides abscessus TaxID=36809 RepID=UPI000927323B|nr:hypothetical protein [Mycobacteroides abscessus]SIB34646.1 Uncharacterised protein [Mycobacteroides abscessus subsp. abscessus]SIG00978.1 Uncharacterised protein [Mycobacteroides abscessus subsp. abscessus]